MRPDCSLYNPAIPKAFMGDLNSDQMKALQEHLLECSHCKREYDLYASTLHELESSEDVPVPRHFFVHPEERATNPWRLFRQMTLGWQAAAAAVAVLFAAGLFALGAQLTIEARDGGYVISFGEGLQEAPPAPIDTAALESRILQVVEENARRENLEWVEILRAEIGRASATATRDQNLLWAGALAGLEERLARRVDQSILAAKEETRESLGNLYETVSLERQQDFADIRNRLARLAINGQIKSNQTDVILETLLQVAELRMTNNPGGSR